MSRNISSQIAHWFESRHEQAKPQADGVVADGALDGDSPQRVLPIETIIIRITEREIYWAMQTGLKKPVLIALQRATGTIWRISDDGIALEVMTPHRACILPTESLFEVDGTVTNRKSLEASWEVPLFPTHQQDGYSLTQRYRLPDMTTKAS